MDSAVLAALVSGGVALVVSDLSAVSARRLQAASLRAAAEDAREAQAAAFRAQEAELRARAEEARAAQEASFLTQEARLRTELRTEFMAEEAIRALLDHRDWTQRSFAEIRRQVRGFPDDELRQLLVRSGAVAFDRKRDGEEMWGLRERNRDALQANSPSGG